MNRRPVKHGFDLGYLRRCKASTPAQRLEWLGIAWEFVTCITRRPAAHRPRK
jgi:hypothetical protein